jgi:hypothetical protein
MENVSTTFGRRPRYYYRDGRPIVSDDPAIPDCLIWAMEFEHIDRTVAKDVTLYGERLSTVFLGLDHSFSNAGPPILFETMLFAPESDELRAAKRDRMRRFMASFDRTEAVESMEELPEEKYIAEHFPHDQLQFRYPSEAYAIDGHRTLKLQCLIPPRWRRFLLGIVADQTEWLTWEDRV